MIDYRRYDQAFGSIIAGLNYDPVTRGGYRADHSVYIRPARTKEIPNALNLTDAKNLHAHLGKLIDQIEAGIEAQKPVLPTAFGSVVGVGNHKYVYLGDLWESAHQAFTSNEIREKNYTVLRDGI